MRIIKFLIILLLVSLFPVGLWLFFSSPVNPAELSCQPFYISPGQSVSEIGYRLQEKGIIKNQTFFRLYLSLNNLDATIQAGEFCLSPASSLKEIITALGHGVSDLRVTILEGWRSEEIGRHLIKTGFPVDFKKWHQLTVGASLEGFLFPDTYFFSPHASEEEIIKALETNFHSQLEKAFLKNKLAQSPFSLAEIVTIASLVEREVSSDKDRPLVAGIIIKRHQTPGWNLQIDATIQYFKGSLNPLSPEAALDWWPADITKEDLKVPSPYNSYLSQALPPTPICNPGLASIKAAFDPEESPYWFYLSDSVGTLHYASTLAGHNQNIRQYLR